MHEFSLASALLDEVARVVISGGGGFVQEVHVEVGPLGGVEPLLLESAFEQLRPGTSSESARLVLHSVPLLAECGECDRRFEVSAFAFACPGCGADGRIVQGDGVILRRVVLTQPDPGGS